MRTPQALCDRLQPVVALHLLDVIARDVFVLIAVYFFHLVANDVQVPVLADPLLGVVQNPDVLIFLTVDENLFGAGFVFQADLVEPSAAFGAHRLDGALGLLVRQRVGNRLVGVVDASRDDRPVRVASQQHCPFATIESELINHFTRLSQRRASSRTPRTGACRTWFPPSPPALSSGRS